MMDLSAFSPDLFVAAGDQIQYLAQQGSQLDGGRIEVNRIGDVTVDFFRGISWVGLIAAAFIVLLTYFIPKKRGGGGRGIGGLTTGAIIGCLLSFYFLYDVNRLFSLLESLTAVVIDIGNWITGVVQGAADGSDTSRQVPR